MDEPISILKEKPPFKSMDFDFLRREAIDYVQKLSGKIWTDYNEHDPGVTILEQLCYAITDLGFRTNFPVEELIQIGSHANQDSIDQLFPPADQIFPTNPINITDYRKLIIDQIDEVKNAWVEAQNTQSLGIQGLYEIWLQLDDSIEKTGFQDSEEQEREEQRIIRKVASLLNKYRNLGEVFEVDTIKCLNQERIEIRAVVDISPDALGESVLANMLYQLKEHINPTIRFYSLNELLEEGRAIEDILEGPRPRLGFIKTEELAPFPTQIFIPKLSEIMAGINGVSRVRGIEVSKSGEDIEGDVIEISKRRVPILDIKLDTDQYDFDTFPIQFYAGGIPYEFDIYTVSQILDNLSAVNRSRYKKQTTLKKSKPAVTRQEDQIKNYISLQHYFPQNYGIGEMGLPLSAPRARIGYARQLKAYLLIFEQLLADYLAQLANFRHLFSLDENIDRSYFTQHPKDWKLTQPREILEDILIGKDNDEFEAKFEAINKDFDPYTKRRNKVLDHLLARMGEQIATDALVSKFKSSSEDEDILEKRSIDAKIHLLKEYVTLSRERATGINFHIPEKLKEGNDDEKWKLLDISALHKKIYLLANIADPKLRMLSPDNFETSALDRRELSDLKYKSETCVFEEDHQGKKITTEIDYALAKREEYDYLESEVSFIFPFKNQKEFNEFITRGSAEENFRIVAAHDNPSNDEEGNHLILYYIKGQAPLIKGEEEESIDELPPETEELQSRGIGGYDDTSEEDEKLIREVKAVAVANASGKKEARQALNKLLAYVKKVNNFGEGFHMVDHIMLRPVSAIKYQLKITDPDQEVYLESYQITDEETQKVIRLDLPIFGKNKENYLVERLSGEQEFRVIVKDNNGNRVLKSTVSFLNEKDAHTEKEKIYDYLRKFDFVVKPSGRTESESSLTEQEQIKQEKSQPKEKKGKRLSLREKTSISKVSEKFRDLSEAYSMKMSILLPSWPLRFQNKDFTNFLKQLIRQHSPAHIACDFYLFDMKEMASFEETYKKWIAAQIDYHHAILDNLEENKDFSAEEVDKLADQRDKYSLALMEKIPGLTKMLEEIKD